MLSRELTVGAVGMRSGHRAGQFILSVRDESEDASQEGGVRAGP